MGSSSSQHSCKKKTAGAQKEPVRAVAYVPDPEQAIVRFRSPANNKENERPDPKPGHDPFYKDESFESLFESMTLTCPSSDGWSLPPRGIEPEGDYTQSLRERLWEQCQEGHFTDLTLLAGGLEIRANKAVLVSETTYFRDLLKRAPSMEIVKIDYFSYVIVRLCVQFAFLGQLAEEDFAEVRGLRDAANFFGMPRLSELCPTDWPPVDRDNVIDEIRMYFMNDDKKHLNDILEFVYANPEVCEELADSEEVAVFDGEYHPLGQDLRRILRMKPMTFEYESVYSSEFSSGSA
ncbi:hypothetical protein M3Y99_00867000 [Aphelenchoides fujianensis]|nr:hypothetical protein M3Y99_00867000 [Aphelenchoides fujianensis]